MHMCVYIYTHIYVHAQVPFWMRHHQHLLHKYAEEGTKRAAANLKRERKTPKGRAESRSYASSDVEHLKVSVYEHIYIYIYIYIYKKLDHMHLVMWNT